MGPLHVALGPEWARLCTVYTEWLIHLRQVCVCGACVRASVCVRVSVCMCVCLRGDYLVYVILLTLLILCVLK